MNCRLFSQATTVVANDNVCPAMKKEFATRNAIKSRPSLLDRWSLISRFLNLFLFVEINRLRGLNKMSAADRYELRSEKLAAR